MDRYKTTFETWNKVASLYQEHFMDLDLYNDSYDLFCRLINKTAPDILEIGCGPGNITKYIISKRPDFKVTAIDVAPNMVDLARINNPTASFKVMDCRNIGTITGRFDGVICGFCIPYLSAEDSSKLLADSFSLLNKGGIIYFSTIKGEYNQSGFETISTGDSSYVYYYTEEHFQNELIKSGFSLLHFFQKDFIKSDGASQPNQIFIAQKK